MRKNIFTILSLFAFLAANAQVWDGSAKMWTVGKGTEAEPYLIETGENLAYLAESVTAGETYEGVFFKLVNNLDMGKEQHKFAPIGFFNEYADPENQGVMIDESKYFLGVFDGNGKTVDNVHIYFIDNENSVGGTGLFACISKNAVVKNLTIGAGSVVEGTNGSGAVVGAMTGGRVENCVNKAPVMITQELGQGGIVGTMYGGTVSGCINDADISGSTNVGGIAGYVDRGGIVENCYNRGAISFKGFYAGGLVGFLVDGTLKNCYSIGETLSDYTGNAVVGTTERDAVIENCYYLETEEGAMDEDARVTKKTADEMKSDDFLAALDNGQNVWKKDVNNINGGFPILGWQDGGSTSIGAAVNTDNFRIVVSGHSVYALVDGPYSITVTDLGGKTIVDRTISGGVLSVPAKGIYVVTVSANGNSRSCKVMIR